MAKNDSGLTTGLLFGRARGYLGEIASSRSVLREARHVPKPWIFQGLKAGNTVTAHEDARPPGPTGVPRRVHGSVIDQRRRRPPINSHQFDALNVCLFRACREAPSRLLTNHFFAIAACAAAKRAIGNRNGLQLT